MADLLEQEESVELSAVPERVPAGAEGALPGFRPERAEREREDGGWEYELEGIHDDRAVEITLDEKGRVLEIEYEDG